MPVSKLIVFGGTGFLGKRICQQGVVRGYEVISLTRRAERPYPVAPSDNYWIKEVKWESADVFKPETYYKQLKGASNVVHSIGILLEDPTYKQKLAPPELPFGPFSTFNKKQPHQVTPQKPDFFTYDMMNTQSAIVLASTFNAVLSDHPHLHESTKPSFTYISADRSFPFIPQGYIDSKRATEKFLLNATKDKEVAPFRAIIMRPGFMYDALNQYNILNPRTFIHGFVDALDCANRLIFDRKLGFVNEIVRPSISTEQVSKSVIEKIGDGSFNGIVRLEDMLDR